MLSTVDVDKAATIPAGISNETIRCFTSLSCDPNDRGMSLTTPSDCCLSAQGLSYSSLGTEQCDSCVCKYNETITSN